MRIKSSADIARMLKKEWDKSENKEEWRVLTGRNPKGRYDMFISSDEKLWQIKIEPIGDYEVIGVGMEVCKMEEEIREIMSKGSPVPFGIISPQKRNLAIIIAGIQNYSSDSAYQLCKEYISDKQAKLDRKLDKEIERMKRDPTLREWYEDYKERERRAYI
ncbi:MAG: hypothetical protein ACXQTS_04225 [Candidatus Methanospirareceae archaeon]